MWLGEIDMSNQGCRWLAICVLLVTCSVPARADFTLDLSLNGAGSVLVISGSGTNTYTTNSMINITSASATVVAQPEPLEIDGVPSAITLPFGNDIELDLTTTLGSKFLEWTGTAIPSINPDDPLDLQDATDQAYVIYSAPNLTQSVTANFSTDLADVAIDQVLFSFDGQNSWVPATSWNFTGDDGPIPSLTGNTLITLAWGDFVALIDLNNTNRVDVQITDKVGNSFLDSFDLDVNSAAAVPEPSSLVLVALAAGCLGRAARVRRKERALREGMGSRGR